MADDNEVNVKFGASIDDLKSKIGEVQGLFKTLTSHFALLAAAVAGGAAFKEFIDTANEINGEAVKLSKTLGITGEAAGTLRTALGDVGVDVDTYTGAFQKFNRQLRSNSEEMKAMGVDVGALKSGQKDSNEIFQEAIKIIGQYKPGIDQNQAAMKLFGRSVEDVQKLQKLFGGTTEETAKKLEEAAKKNRELNLTITQESVTATRKYKEAMNDVNDVLEGVKKTIGEAVIPLFTKSAEQLASIGPMLVEATQAAVEVFVAIWNTVGETISVVWGAVKEALSAIGDLVAAVFGRDGPSAMEVFKNALRLVQALFIGFRVAVELIVLTIKTGFQHLGNLLVSFAAVAERALHFDFKGANAEWKAGVAERVRILEEATQRAGQIASKGKADLENALTGGSGGGASKTPLGAPKGGTKQFELRDKGAEAAAAKLAAAQRELEKARIEASLALQEEYLREYQSQLDEGYKRNLISNKDYYAAKLAGELLSGDATIAAKRKELEETKKLELGVKDPAQKLKFQAQEQKLLGEINVLEAKRVDTVRANADAYADAEQQRLDALAVIRTQREKAAADASIANDTAELAQKKALRQVSAEEEFAAQRVLEQRSYSATLAALQAKAAAIHGTEQEAEKQREALYAEAEAAETQHQQRLSQIDRAAVLERQKYSIQAQQSVQSSFSTMVSQLINGTTKLRDVFRGFAQSVTATFVDLISKKFTDKLFDATGVNKAIDKMVGFVTSGVEKMVEKWVTGKVTEEAATTASEATKTAAVVSGSTAREAAEAATKATAMAEQQAMGVAAVLSYASIAAVAAMASVAAIPFTGWAMAPEVGAATYATGLAYLASAAGGWDEVPGDQLAQLHKKEMVLSAPIADGLRQLIASSNAQQGSGQVGKMAVNWAEGNASSRESSALDKTQALTSGSPVGWRVPASPLSRIQSSGVDSSAPGVAGSRGRSGDTHNWTVQAIDAAGVKKLFMDHGGTIATALRKQARNFTSVSPTK